MPTRDETKATIERVQSLIRQATDPAVSVEEARSFAMAAIKSMTDEKLTVVPADVVDQIKSTIHGANLAVQQARQNAQGRMIMGALLGFAGAQFLKV